jgi:hypothetical protein
MMRKLWVKVCNCYSWIEKGLGRDEDNTVERERVSRMGQKQKYIDVSISEKS